ncbi:predicted protein [Chaetoceros tenuissimus]|uniref:Uncharacterized protein n=1 Tax=Chaetoceros tenuissimus TaxID=426638 RepID=A0AAD3GZ66_9STRA|nr:predicted protein [Chaetoceros tenuissimus]
MTTTKPDLFELYYHGELKKIEAILDSAEYTREEKIAMILYKSDIKVCRGYPSMYRSAEEKILFAHLFLCRPWSSFYKKHSEEHLVLLVKVIRILGKTLASQTCLEYPVEKIIRGKRCLEEKIVLLRVVTEELSDFKFSYGDTILHVVARCYSHNFLGRHYRQHEEDEYVKEELWNILPCNKDLVMKQNKDGKTALHVACENSEIFLIEALIKKGGRDLVWKRDNEKNTALHLLPFRVSCPKDVHNFDCLKNLIEIGGKELLHSLNNKRRSPVTPFFIKALEFQFDWESKNEKIKLLQEKVNSLKNKLKAQKKQIEVLNETNKKLQEEEKESKQRNGQTREDSMKPLREEIKFLQDVQTSFQNEVHEQKGLVKNLQNERKQADLEFEIVKTMHEENKDAYEKCLIEFGKLKGEKQAQRDDINEQKEMIQKLQEALKEKDARIEDNESKLRDLEEDNHRLREAENNVKQLLYISGPASTKVEESNGEVDESLKGINVLNLEKEIQTLQDTIKKQKQIVEEKQKENKMLKDENESLNNKVSSSCMKRSRDDTEQEIDCIEEDEDDIYGPPSKRGKTRRALTERKTEYARNHVSSLEGEIEDLIKDLEYEK